MNDAWITAARFLGIGWFIAVCIVGGVFGGRWVGQQAGNEVVFSLLGLAVGVMLAGYGVYESYLLIKKSENKDNGKEEK
ncbi:MAG: AtpZ/AtpI family protein [Chloroflexi bacterium]|nr:AtpZ/AtpI family protein [Chloroflexota bacterium]